MIFGIRVDLVGGSWGLAGVDLCAAEVAFPAQVLQAPGLTRRAFLGLPRARRPIVRTTP